MTTEERLLKIPIISWFIRVFKKIKVPGLEGMSLYDVLEMYIIGIVQGALTSRAGAVAFSFFMALFPFALFILTLIPYIQIEGFQDGFMQFINHALPPNTSEAVDDVFKDIIANKYGGLLSFGFVLSVFLMTNGINSLFGGFEYTYHKLQTRSIIRQYVVSLAVSIILASLLLITVAVIIYFEIAITNLEQKDYISDDLFWIGIPGVPFVDVLNTMSDSTIPLTKCSNASSIIATLFYLSLFQSRPLILLQRQLHPQI